MMIYYTFRFVHRMPRFCVEASHICIRDYQTTFTIMMVMGVVMIDHVILKNSIQHLIML